MLKQLPGVAVAIVLLVISFYLVIVSAGIFSAEVWPAVRNLSFTVETDSMILNRVWKGNDIYLLLLLYLTLSGAFAYGAIRLLKHAFSDNKITTER